MSGWVWLGLAALLGLTELAAPGLYLVFFAAAAALTGVLALVSPEAPVWAQVACFALASVAAVLFGRRLYHERPVATADPLLNDRAERLVGTVVTVEEAIVAGHGRVRVGDGTWPATGPNALAGDAMRVVGQDGGELIVEPVASGQKDEVGRDEAATRLDRE